MWIENHLLPSAKWPDFGHPRGPHSHWQLHGQVWIPTIKFIFRCNHYVPQTLRMTNFTGALLMTVFHPSSSTPTRDMSRWSSLQFEPSNTLKDVRLSSLAFPHSKFSGAGSQEGTVQSRHPARHEARPGELPIVQVEFIPLIPGAAG